MADSIRGGVKIEVADKILKEERMALRLGIKKKPAQKIVPLGDIFRHRADFNAVACGKNQSFRNERGIEKTRQFHPDPALDKREPFADFYRSRFMIQADQNDIHVR